LTKQSQKSEQILEAALRLFSTQGFYATTIPQIAKSIGMSSGNIYNYFKSKELLASEIIKYSSRMVADRIRVINESPLDTRAKIHKIVEEYFDIAQKKPEHLNYFLRVFLSNKEIFKDRCEGMLCVQEFMTELMVFFEEGVRKGDLRNQDFFTAFGLFMGYLGGFVFLNGENVLNRNLSSYTHEIAENIYRALKSEDG
jgi:AcrR family transcriptional regulator